MRLGDRWYLNAFQNHKDNVVTQRKFDERILSMLKRSGILSRFVTVAGGTVGENPVVTAIKHFGDNREVVSAKRLRILPILAVLVESADGHVMTRAILGFVFPNRRSDSTEANLLNGFGLWIRFR